MTEQLPATRVPAEFDDAAATYDLMVRLSPGYHAQLRRSAQRLVDALPDRQRPPDPLPALHLLDLGCGSGASTRALTRALADGGRSPAQITGVDASAGMLAAAQAKSWPPGVQFCHGLAQDLPALMPAGTRFDGVFAAYLLRNVPDRDRLLSMLFEMTAPGGPVVFHEYSVDGNRRAQLVWTAVCRAVIIPLAAVVVRRTRLYHYLWRSVLAFDSVAQVEQRLRNAGFVEVRTDSMPGWQNGIVHAFSARRPT